MITVACVLRSGGPYDVEYANRLQAGVSLHLPQAKFVCLSDVPLPCERVELLHDWPGWWAKMELFRIRGPVLYFDLDTVIVGELTEVAGQAAKGFTMLSDFFRPRRLQSGVIGWPGDVSGVYEHFAASADRIMRSFRGDGEYLSTCAPCASRWQQAVPGQIVSRKVARTRNPNERVVCFHGQPRPRDVAWSVY